MDPLLNCPVYPYKTLTRPSEAQINSPTTSNSLTIVHLPTDVIVNIIKKAVHTIEDFGSISLTCYPFYRAVRQPLVIASLFRNKLITLMPQHRAIAFLCHHARDVQNLSLDFSLLNVIISRSNYSLTDDNILQLACIGSSLTALNLDGCEQITSNAFASSFSRLKHLNIRGCFKLTEEAFARIANYASTLTSLYFYTDTRYGYNLNEVGWHHITNLTRLQHLDLSYSQIYPQIKDVVRNCSSVTSLVLNDISLNGYFLDFLAATCTKISHLEMTEVTLTNDIVSVLAKCTNLTSLILESRRSCQITHAGSYSFICLTRLTHLRFPFFESITDGHLAGIFSELPSLRSFEIRYWKMKPEQQSMRPFAVATQLSRLVISSLYIEDKDLNSIEMLTNLRCLKLYSCTPITLPRITRLLNNSTHIKHLTILDSQKKYPSEEIQKVKAAYQKRIDIIQPD